MSTSSEEFRKFVNRLLYEETKINIQKQLIVLKNIPQPLTYVSSWVCKLLTYKVTMFNLI